MTNISTKKFFLITTTYFVSMENMKLMVDFLSLLRISLLLKLNKWPLINTLILKSFALSVVRAKTSRLLYLVACCYRPPNSSQKWFLSFKEFLKWANRAYEKILVTGDFNVPKISWSESTVIPGGEPEYLFYNTLSGGVLIRSSLFG